MNNEEVIRTTEAFFKKCQEQGSYSVWTKDENGNPVLNVVRREERGNYCESTSKG